MIKFITLLLLFVVFSDAYAQFDLNKELPRSKDVIYDSLSNGLKYYIKRNSKPENRAEIQLIVKAGSLQEKDSQLGLAHFLEHMAFNGTKNFPGNEVIKYMESTGMRFGSDINASTSWERTYYTLQVPTDNEKMFKDGFLVLKDWLSGITLDEEEIEKERKVIIEEWRARTQNAQGRVKQEQFETLFKGSAYSKFPIGDTAIIMNAPKKEFEDYYNTYYQPDISAVIAVGDFDVKLVESLIKEMFSEIPRPKKPTDIGDYKMTFTGESRVMNTADPELQANVITAIIKMPTQTKGTYGAYRNSIVTNILNTMLSKRYQEVALKGDAPFLQAVSVLTPFPGDITAFYNVVILKGDKMKEGYERFLTELYRANKHGFVESELERAKKEILKQYESIVKEKDKTESSAWAEELSRHFLENEGYPGVEHEFEIVDKFLPTITLDEINKKMASLVTDKNLYIFQYGPKADVLIAEDKLIPIYKEVGKRSIEPYIDKSAGLRLMDKRPKGGSFVDMDENAEFGLTLYELDNGVKVILKKTDFKNDEVRMRAYSPGGLSLAKDDIFLSASNAASVVNYAGIAEFDLSTLQKVLTGKQVSVSPFIGDLNEGFSGYASPDDLEEMFQLVYLYFTQPRKDEESFISLKSRLLEQIKQSKNNPEQIFSDSVSYLLTNYHFRSKPLTEERVNQIDMDKAVEFYLDRFADASDFTFIFVGNFEESAINPLITSYLGALPNTSRKENWVDTKSRMIKEKLDRRFKIGKDDNSTVRLILNGDYDYSPENDLHLDAMTRVLGILLLEEIREKMGGVYSIGAYNRTSKLPEPNYTIFVPYGCEPARVDELNAAILKVMEKLKTDNLDAEYLKRATETMKSEYKKQLQDNSFWISNIYYYDFYQLDMAFINQYLDKVDALNVNDIQNAAKKYLNQNSLKTLVRYPENFKN
jgi:zinc protease